MCHNLHHSVLLRSVSLTGAILWAAATAPNLAAMPGDFNGDGIDDVVVGVPGEDGSGAVQVIYGTSAGLDDDQVLPDVILRRGIANMDGASEPGEQFGAALAVGDFNGD